MSDFDVAEKIKDSQEKLQQDLAQYRQTMYFLGANVPIAVLCLPRRLENILVEDGCLRVYDLINRDFTKIKGIGKTHLSLLTSRVDEFLSISL